MSIGRWLVIGVTLIACYAAGIYSANIDPKPMSTEDAKKFALRALAESGVRDVSVSTDIKSGSFATAGSEPVKVWRVPVKVGDDEIILSIEQTGNQVINLDDLIGPDRHLLSDKQFEALARFRDDPVGDRTRRRQLLPALLAGALVGLSGAALAIVAGKSEGLLIEQRTDGIYDVVGANQ